jgi:hypothetical protein
MKSAFRVLLLLMSCTVAFGTTRVLTDYISITPTNAAQHGLSFAYNPTSSWVTVTMPYTNGGFTFDGAALRWTNGVRESDIPVKGMQIEGTPIEGKPQDMLVVAFRMDRRTLGESRLTISFRKLLRGVDYLLSPSDFISKRED